MSAHSSISSSDAAVSGAIAPRFLHSLFVGTTIWAAAFFLSTFSIDPYGVSPVSFVVPRFNEHKPKRIDIDRQIKPIEVWRYQPKTVFLGTSRIHQSIDPRSLAATPLAPAYNGSVPAMSLGMNITYLERYVELDRNLRNVFAELFLYNFLGQGQDRSALGLRDMVRDVASLMLSSDALWDSIATLLYNLGGGKLTFSIARDGYFVFPEDFEAKGTFDAFYDGMWALTPKPPRKLQLHEPAFQSVAELIERAKRHNLELRFLATPNHAYFDYFIDYVDAWPLVEEWLRRLTSMTDVYSFAQANAWTHEPVERHMRYWNDPIHFSLIVGRAIVAEIAGKPAADAPANFMIKLSPDNIAAHVEQRRVAIRKWAEENPEFVDKFRDGHFRWLRAHGQAVPAAPPPRILGKVSAEALTLNGVVYPLVRRIGGSLEGVNEDAERLEVTGWAADHANNKPAAAIVAAVGDDVVSRVSPGVTRPDIEGGIGSGVRPAGFSMRIPLSGGGNSPKSVRLFALTSDGKAVPISAAMPPGRYAVIEKVSFPSN